MPRVHASGIPKVQVGERVVEFSPEGVSVELSQEEHDDLVGVPGFSTFTGESDFAGSKEPHVEQVSPPLPIVLNDQPLPFSEGTLIRIQRASAASGRSPDVLLDELLTSWETSVAAFASGAPVPAPSTEETEATEEAKATKPKSARSRH